MNIWWVKTEIQVKDIDYLPRVNHFYYLKNNSTLHSSKLITLCLRMTKHPREIVLLKAQKTKPLKGAPLHSMSNSQMDKCTSAMLIYLPILPAIINKNLINLAWMDSFFSMDNANRSRSHLRNPRLKTPIIKIWFLRLLTGWWDHKYMLWSQNCHQTQKALPPKAKTKRILEAKEGEFTEIS